MTAMNACHFIISGCEFKKRKINFNRENELLQIFYIRFYS